MNFSKFSTRLPRLTFFTAIKDILQYLGYQTHFTFLAYSLNNETKQQIPLIFLRYCGSFNRLFIKSHERLLNFSFRRSLLQMFFKIFVHACNFVKKRFQHRCFPVNIAKFLRTAFFTEHLWWLLLQFQMRVTKS